ncbi:PREDICTED: ankyrin repeat domain-containing protein 26-like [Ficedula albicollis]|uniref:ankyrin repeat domain-containing protein 26-like n=1 Tax=Ficedula albicollis TaxID=59894 RepID=UPI0007AD960A|nr:PREDICTED: ankyrin repeat domain-containing protein 26-like [Ficedula albicollis]
MSEASLEVTTRYRSDLEEDKLRLQKVLEKAKTKLWEVEEKYLQSECCVRDLKTALDDKERGATASAQKLQDQLLASSETNTTIKQLEEHCNTLKLKTPNWKPLSSNKATGLKPCRKTCKSLPQFISAWKT